jgi:hypothetical protein
MEYEPAGNISAGIVRIMGLIIVWKVLPLSSVTA